jgi:hypothetical protein
MRCDWTACVNARSALFCTVVTVVAGAAPVMKSAATRPAMSVRPLTRSITDDEIGERLVRDLAFPLLEKTLDMVTL